MIRKGEVDVDDHQDVETQAKLWKHIFGFAETLALRSAVEMRLPDIIFNSTTKAGGGPISLSELAAGLPFPDPNLDSLYRLMRFLVHMKIFNEETNAGGEILYGLEPAARLLLRDAEKSMAPIVLWGSHRDFTLPWHYIKDGLTEDGGTAFENAMGMTLWDYLADDPVKSERFNEVMASESRLLTSSLVRGCREMFAGLESIVDVGGGNGTTIRAVSKAFPSLKCAVFDLPHVISGSPAIPGVERIPGDMFESQLPTAQAVMLKLVLHDWSDEDCVKILRRCKEAVPRDGGKVIIVDVVSDADAEHPFSKPRMVLDIDMLVFTGGRERTEQDWKRLILKAGYRGYQITHIEAIQSVIEAFPY